MHRQLPQTRVSIRTDNGSSNVDSALAATWNFSPAPLACQQVIPFSGGQTLLDMDAVVRASAEFIYKGCRFPAFHMQSVGKRLWCELKLTCRDLHDKWVASQTQKGIFSFKGNDLPVRYHIAEPVLQCLRGKNINKNNCVQLIAVHYTYSGCLLLQRPQGFTMCAPNQCAFCSCFKICHQIHSS